MIGVVIREEEPDGALVVTGGRARARDLRRFGAVITPSGEWRIPSRYAPAFKRAAARAEPQPALSTIDAVARAAPMTPATPDLAAVDRALCGLPGLWSRRRGAVLELRLTRRSRTAAAVLKAIPGATWRPEAGTWSLAVRTAAQETSLLGLPKTLAQAFAAGRRSRTSEIERVFTLSACPDLDVATDLDGRQALFTSAGKLFKLNAGHERRHPHLAGRSGELACVFYGAWIAKVEPQSPEE